MECHYCQTQFISLRESTDEDLSKDESNLVISDQFLKVILSLLIVPAAVALDSKE